MYCTRNVTEDLIWVGADDRRLACFEGVYGVPDGVSYNSYLLLDEKTVLFDTVDKAVYSVFLENVAHALNGRKLDYLVVHHMEPDHAATQELLLQRYPEAKIICNAKIQTMMKQFLGCDLSERTILVKEGDTFSTGKHNFTFVMAPMVHWPEVMMSYDLTDKILFTADAFGTFGALNGRLFNDEADFFTENLDEARRYYTNIVGKYGPQVQAVLKKAAKLDIALVCPLHGFVWRSHFGDFLEKYLLWSSYTPEEKSVLLAYASVYGHTENAANILACKLNERGVRVRMYDTSVTPASYIVSDAFRCSHLVFAATTYNAGVFVTMEQLLHDIAAHNLQNRKVALIENGSWAPTSGKLMRGIMEGCRNMTILNESLTIKSALKEEQLTQLDAIADAIDATIEKKTEVTPIEPAAAAEAVQTYQPVLDAAAMFKLSYGLFVLTAKDGQKDNGCIINTASQVTAEPNRVTIAVNKNNYTHDMIKKTGVFNVSILSQDVTFDTFRHFGFQSGRDTDKFAGYADAERSANGLYYLTKGVNALISGKVIQEIEFETHTLFVAEVTECRILSDEASVTYAYYFEHIKPKPQPAAEKQTGWVCKICGYVYEGEDLPEDFICPLCKHPASDFEKLQ